MNLFHKQRKSYGRKLYNKIITTYESGYIENIKDTLSCLDELKYKNALNIFDEEEWFHKIADFLFDNNLYQYYYNYLTKIVSSDLNYYYINDENAINRLKLFELRTLSNCGEYSYKTYKLLYENLTRNLYAKSQVKTPEELLEEVHKIYPN